MRRLALSPLYFRQLKTDKACALIITLPLGNSPLPQEKLLVCQKTLKSDLKYPTFTSNMLIANVVFIAKCNPYDANNPYYNITLAVQCSIEDIG